MVNSLLSEKPVPGLSQHPQARASRLFANVVVILLIAVSVLAVPYAVLGVQSFLFYQVNPLPVPLLLLYVYVVGGGCLFMVLSLCFPLLRLTLWQVALILLGTFLGMVVGLHQVAYQEECCMFGYQFGYGFPFAVVMDNYLSYTLIPWHQVYEILRQHPNQISQQIDWAALIADGIFFANLALIPVALVEVGLRCVGRAERPYSSRRVRKATTGTELLGKLGE